jgi:uncharacterized protein (TIGR03083 family)
MHTRHPPLSRRPIAPISTVALFAPLGEALHSLLRRLKPADWQMPTVCGDWTVKDVAAHLLGGNLGRLSFQRDRLTRTPRNEAPLGSDELAAFVNRSNADWVTAAVCISPNLIVDFLELTDLQLAEFVKTLPPDEPANIGVSWAGDVISPNWFDIAREYTEKWVHQQHIRDAVDRPGMGEPQWLSPVRDTFMRALPYTYRGVAAPDGTAINFTLSGPAGGQWTLLRQGELWHLFSGLSASAASHVWLAEDLAWRLFTKGLVPAGVLPLMHIDGARALGERITQMVSIVA